MPRRRWQVYFVPRRQRRRDGRAGCDPQPFAYGGARKGRSAMIIYGSVVSPFVRKLLGYLGEKGNAFELKGVGIGDPDPGFRSEEHTSELQSLMCISYAFFCFKKKKTEKIIYPYTTTQYRKQPR